MGSLPEPRDVVGTIAVTGFEPWLGVTCNPSEVLVRSLADAYRGRLPPRADLAAARHSWEAGEAGSQELGEDPTLPAYGLSPRLARGWCLGRCTVLPVVGKPALPNLVRVLRDPLGTEPYQGGGIAQPESRDVGSKKQHVRVIWLHLGLGHDVPCFHLEQLAANDASFRCPDEMGWAPQHEAIYSEDGPVTAFRETSLPVQWLRGQLSARGFPVTISLDAGRFVCNYVYYQSLRMSASVSSMAEKTAASVPMGPPEPNSGVSHEEHAGTRGPTNLPRRPEEEGRGAVPKLQERLHCSGSAGEGTPIPLAVQGPAWISGGPGDEVWASLFVHVPSFHIIPLQQQLRFLVCLVELLSHCGL